MSYVDKKLKHEQHRHTTKVHIAFYMYNISIE